MTAERINGESFLTLAKVHSVELGAIKGLSQLK